MQCEFEKLLGKSVPEADYRLIEIVYQFHPSNLSKEATVALYKEFGMALIRDMLPRADKMKELEENLRRAQGEVFKYQKLIDAVKNGYDLKDLEKGE
jgi:hypothetical protein